MATSSTNRSSMKPYQKRMEEHIHKQTMLLWEKGLLPKRRPWRGEPVRPAVMYVPTGLIQPAKTGDMLEDE